MGEFKHVRSVGFLKRADGWLHSLGEIKVERITETTEHVDPQSGVVVNVRRVVNGIVVYDGKPAEEA
jgi:hypothetical protein